MRATRFWPYNFSVPSPDENAFRAQAGAGTAVPAPAGALAGASVASLSALASAWEFSVELSAAVAPPSNDPVASALWAFSALSADCVLNTLPSTPAAAAFASLTAPHAPFSYVLVRAPPPAPPLPSVFRLPLPWTRPFEWRLWAVTGASILLASAAQDAFEKERRRRDAAAAAAAAAAPGGKRSWGGAGAALLLPLLGWRFAPPATPAGRLHATAFAFTSAILAAQYIATAAALASAGGAAFVAPASPLTAVCVADNAAHAAFAAAALPSLQLLRRSSASAGALLAALHSGACAAAVTTDLDLAYAAGGPGDAGHANCGLPAAMPLGRGALALALAPATPPNVTHALGILLTYAAAPGGAFAAAAAAQFPAAPCGADALGADAAAAAPAPLSLRDLSGVFMLQVVAIAAAALLHVGGAAGRALATRAARRAQERDGGGGGGGQGVAAKKRHGGRAAAPAGADDDVAASAAENGGAIHGSWAQGSGRGSDSASGGADDYDGSYGVELRAAPLVVASSPRTLRRDAAGAATGAVSPALRAAVAAMQADMHAELGGDGHGWAAAEQPGRRIGGRSAAVASLRAELLAVEADAAAELARGGTPSSSAALSALSAPPPRSAGARARSRTPPRGGAVSAGPAQFAPPARSSERRAHGTASAPRSPRGAQGRFGGRPALPRDAGDDFLDDRL
jgi:hypothetical protein